MSNSKELIANLSGPQEVREFAKKELVNINENDLVLLAQQSELSIKHVGKVLLRNGEDDYEFH